LRVIGRDEERIEIGGFELQQRTRIIRFRLGLSSIPADRVEQGIRRLSSLTRPAARVAS